MEYEEEEARRERRRTIRNLWNQQIVNIQQSIENACNTELETGRRGLTNLELQNRCYIERGKRRLNPVRSMLRRLAVLHQVTPEEGNALVSEEIRNMRRDCVEVEGKNGELLRRHVHPDMIDVFAVPVERYYLIDENEQSITELEGKPEDGEELEPGQVVRPRRTWEYQRLDKEQADYYISNKDARYAGEVAKLQTDLLDLREFVGIDPDRAIERTTEAVSTYAYYVSQPSQDALRGFNIGNNNQNQQRRRRP